MHRVVSLLLTVLLAACGTTSGVDRDFKLDPAGPNGLVVGTITYESFTGSYGIGWRSRAGEGQYGASVGFSNWPPLGPEYDTDLKAKGGTFVVAVPAGEYSVRGWSIRQGMTIYSPSSPVDLPFRVEAGKTTYLGNFNFRKSDEVSLEDLSERDLPVLKARYLAVAGAPLAASIARGTNIESLGGEMKKRFLTPIIVPVGR